MKPSRISPPVFLLLTAGMCFGAFFAGDQTGQWLSPGWSEPSIVQAAPPAAETPAQVLSAAPARPQTQEDSLFILLGSSASGTRATVWHISELPGSPVFMHLLVPSARFGEAFDESFYTLNVGLSLTREEKQAVEALFAEQGVHWNKIVIMDLSLLAATLHEISSTQDAAIEPGKILAPLPRLQGDPRARALIIQDQLAIWDGLCPLFVAAPADLVSAHHLFRQDATYPVCVVADDLH